MVHLLQAKGKKDIFNNPKVNENISKKGRKGKHP